MQAETPLGLRLTPPRKPIGKKTHTFGAMFVDPSKLAASIKFAGSGAVSNVSIADLLTKHAKALKAIKLDLKPDTPKISKDLVKLPVLDAQMVASGKPSIFTSTPQKLAISGSGVNRKVSLATTVFGHFQRVDQRRRHNEEGITLHARGSLRRADVKTLRLHRGRAFPILKPSGSSYRRRSWPGLAAGLPLGLRPQATRSLFT